MDVIKFIRMASVHIITSTLYNNVISLLIYKTKFIYIKKMNSLNNGQLSWCYYSGHNSLFDFHK